ncbi:MAG: tyrosine-type recombinase/integrase [Syntrophobacteraceae bacterium]|jgi:type 1 fimbriae regulatory protein FimB
MTNDREHITVREVEKLMAAGRGTRFEARDRCLLLMMFRHGLRVSAACALQLDHASRERPTRQIDVSRDRPARYALARRRVVISFR